MTIRTITIKSIDNSDLTKIVRFQSGNLFRIYWHPVRILPGLGLVDDCPRAGVLEGREEQAPQRAPLLLLKVVQPQ